MGSIALDDRPDRGDVVTGVRDQSTISSAISADISAEMAWLAKVADVRFMLYFGKETAVRDVREVLPPDLKSPAFVRLISERSATFEERLAIALALAWHVQPELLDVFFIRNETFGRSFSEFGGIASNDGPFKPTGDTLAFLAAGADIPRRLSVRRLLEPDHWLVADRIIAPPSRADQPPMKSPLELTGECLSLLTTGHSERPDFGVGFPAQRMETMAEWHELVLHPHTQAQVEEIGAWLQHKDVLMNQWGMAAKLRPGYRALFYGPPGTGKTLTACLLGKSVDLPVYRVDLSRVVSKYIGETEKNLARVFEEAERRDWLLFFDEADALFGKRTETKDAHDRYANQEVSFLLQRLEVFEGLTILASNLRENIDNAFVRRFESVVYFPMPRPEERVQLWKQGFPVPATLDETVDLHKISEEHDLSGGDIMNVIRYAALEALRGGNRPITGDDLIKGIYREYRKDGRSS